MDSTTARILETLGETGRSFESVVARPRTESERPKMKARIREYDDEERNN